MYQEFHPSETLRHLIDSFWMFKASETDESYKVLPDTCTDLIIDLNQNESFFSGVMSVFQMRQLAAGSNLIGIRFKTEQFGTLCKTPLSETKNERITLSDIFPSESQNLPTEVNAQKTVSDRICLLESFITKTFEDNCGQKDKMVLAVAQKIRQHHGQVPITALLDSFPISPRQIERRFKRRVGLTIKEFSNIVRFNQAKKIISSSPETSLLTVAFDTGFFDHSHLNYEFNRLSGENPTFFR